MSCGAGRLRSPSKCSSHFLFLDQILIAHPCLPPIPLACYIFPQVPYGSIKVPHIFMISCLFSLCCQRPKIAAFVCLKAPFDTPVHPFVLLLCHNSSCSAVVNSCLLGFRFVDLIQCLCGNPSLVVGVPPTQHFIACRCDHTFHSLQP